MYKTFFVVFLVGLGIHATSLDWSQLPPVEQWRTPWASDPDVVAALEAKCASPDWDVECVDELSERFASGELDPIAVIRSHCSRWESPWERSDPTPPQLCRERFGGWIRG